MTTAIQASRRWAVALPLVLLGVMVVGTVAVRFAPAGSSVAVWWPAAGLAAAFLLATGPDRRRAAVVVAGVVVASAAANSLGGRPPLAAACFGLANAAEAALFWYLMTRRGRRPRLASPDDLGRLVLATLAGALAFGCLAGLIVASTLRGTFFPTAYAVAASHAAAVLSMAPLGIALSTRSVRSRHLEKTLQWLALLAVTLWVFGSTSGLPLAFLPLPILALGATRLGLRTIAAQLVALGVVVVTLTSRGGGPFAAVGRAGGRPETVGALTQAFLVTATITALALAVATVQRRDALVELSREATFTRVVLDTVASAIVVLDPMGRIERLNSTAARYLGTSAEEGVGQRASDLDLPGGSPIPAGRSPHERDSTQEQDRDVPGLGLRHLVWTSVTLPEQTGRTEHVVKTGTDVTDERASYALVDTVLQSAAATAIIGTDDSGLITLFSRGATNLLGYTAEEVVGSVNWLDLHDPDEVAARAAELGLVAGPSVLVHSLAGSASAETRDWTWMTRDGRRIVVDLTTSAILDTGGRATGYVGVAEDVTERRRADDAVQLALQRERRAVEELTALDRTKTDFLSAVSHELRTPLASVLGYAEMLEDGAVGALAPRQLDLVSRIDRNGRRLLALIEDLLLNSRIESGQLHLARRRCDLREVVDNAWDAMGPLTHSRELHLHREVGSDVVAVDGDPAALERAVTNLLSNAVKFTPDGGSVTLTLSTNGSSSERAQAKLVVSDTGYGIAEHDVSQVFRRFFRSSDATAKAIQGTGLGLSIVKAIVEGHDGTLEVASTPGEGSSFTVLVPLAPRP